MTNYIRPTAADIPPIRVVFEETPYAHGPGGAKGIGELPMDGPAPAIANAIENALDVPVDHVPLMPERIMNLMDQVWEECGAGTRACAPSLPIPGPTSTDPSLLA